MKHIHHAINTHIGKRTSARRVELKLSLEKLSLHSGIPIVELHRIEEGEIVITALQVFNLSHALHVSTTFFFEKYYDNKKEEMELLLAKYVNNLDASFRIKLMHLLAASDYKPNLN